MSAGNPPAPLGAFHGTRRSLHAVAEQLLSGPQYRTSGTIRLQVTPGGFATVARPPLAVTPASLRAGDLDLPLDGATIASLAGAAGIEPGPPEGLYSDYTGFGVDEQLSVDPAVAGELFAALNRGDAALRRLAPDANPVLWPEHFDLALAIDDVTYGVSPGDDHLGDPYAYVAPWAARTGPFWNAPFGAARPLRDLPGEALDTFFGEGRTLTQRA
jgi:hypothetical protein